jgi:hypothetical protein
VLPVAVRVTGIGFEPFEPQKDTMNKNLRKFVATVALAGSALTVGIGAANAQSTSTTTTSTATTTKVKPANGGFGAHAPAIAKALGMTVDELNAARTAGKTIAQLATEKGVNLQSIINAWVAEEQAEHPTMAAADVLKRVTDSANNVKTARVPRTKTVTSTTVAA